MRTVVVGVSKTLIYVGMSRVEAFRDKGERRRGEPGCISCMTDLSDSSGLRFGKVDSAQKVWSMYNTTTTTSCLTNEQHG